MKTKYATTLALSLAILAGAVLAQQRGIASLDKAAPPLQGFVYEIKKDNKPGLDGVDISLRRADGSYLRRNEDTTNSEGYFEIPLTAGQVEELRGGYIEFRKDPYKNAPERRKLTPKSKDRIVVGLWLPGQSLASIDKAMAHINSLPAGEERSALIATVASLPPNEREVARSALGSSGNQILVAEFRMAEQAASTKTQIDAELLKRNYGGNVFTQSNQPAVGKVYVGGVVRDRKELNELEDITRGFGVRTTAVVIGSERGGISAKK